MPSFSSNLITPSTDDRFDRAYSSAFAYLDLSEVLQSYVSSINRRKILFFVRPCTCFPTCWTSASRSDLDSRLWCHLIPIEYQAFSKTYIALLPLGRPRAI